MPTSLSFVSIMLASRVLPPIVRPPSPPAPAPVATFFHVPRRYARSNMQVGDSVPDLRRDDTKRSRSLRKRNPAQDVRSTPTSSPMQRAKEEGLLSPAPGSPRFTRKRVVSLDESNNEDEPMDSTSPTDVKSPRSASSTQSGEFSPHVCLCQPEPKIPRPRNGEWAFPFVLQRIFPIGVL